VTLVDFGHAASDQIRIQNIETSNNIRMTQIQMSQTHWRAANGLRYGDPVSGGRFQHLIFEISICFGFRASSFGFDKYCESASGKVNRVGGSESEEGSGTW
jgi:hypothetical protein